MSIKMKLFTAFVMTMLVVMSSTACTGEKNEPQTKLASATTSASSGGNNTADKSTGVFSMFGVTTAAKGKMHNFKWNQNGIENVLSDLIKNKVAFINFWGTWCPPCRMEIPSIIQITQELESKDFVTIGIALEKDIEEATKIQKVQNFANAKGINYINFIGNNDIINAFGGVPAVPTTYIIDKSGNIVETIVGAQSKEAFMRSINKVLK